MLDYTMPDYITPNYTNNMFISAIKAGFTKLLKYFPRWLTGNNLILYKPYLFAIFLDPRFKTALFCEGR